MAERSSRLAMLLTPDERDQFEAAAKDSGETLSAWLRRAGRERLQRDRRSERVKT